MPSLVCLKNGMKILYLHIQNTMCRSTVMWEKVPVQGQDHIQSIGDVMFTAEQNNPTELWASFSREKSPESNT